MKDLKHTPAPWKMTKNEYNDVAPLFIQAGTSILADVHKNIHNEKESEANAKLIASAPELLEALIELRAVAVDKGLDIDSPLNLRVSHAIKKATE